MTPQELLGLPLPANDSGATTVRGYLLELLTGVWREEEGFSGKRPFGNSSWQYDIYIPMIAAGAVDGATLDEDGIAGPWNEWRDSGRPKADELILAAIKVL